MTLDHSLIEELSAAEALDGLDTTDVALLSRERAAHGDCAECREIEAAFSETAGRLASALTPLPVDDSMVGRILGSTRDHGVATVASRAADVPSDERDELSDRRARSPLAWRALAAAAAIAVVLVVALTTLRPTSTSVDLVSTGQRVVAFEGSGATATLAVAYTPGEAGAVVWGSLPDPGEGHVYEIWTLDDGEAISGGCVSPTDGAVALTVDADVGSAGAMAVTREPSSCPSTPTSPPILSADLAIA